MADHVVGMLGSVRAAMREGDELIVVDDGSSDGTAAICRDWLRQYCPDGVLVEQSNQGVCASRNAALARAKNEYVLFLDGDDELVPAAIDAARLILARFNPDLVEFDFDYWSSKSGASFKPGPSKSYRSGILITNAEEIFCATLNDRSWALWGRLIRRSLLASEGELFFPETLSIDDLPTTPRIAARARSLYYHPEPIIRYRLSDNSLSKQRSARHCLDIALATVVVVNDLRRIHLSKLMEESMRLWVARIFYEAIRMAIQSPERHHRLFEEIYKRSVGQIYKNPTEVILSLMATSIELDRKIAREIARFARHPYLQGWMRLLSSLIRRSN